ncbi:MAG: respiratory nitrate reductase subunit gamma [Rhodobacteraceae bacterium]|nr:respiratory nitrate reductase subunit gamma [Paracoccaceae bacterium]
MNEVLNSALFGVYPYVAVAVLVVGSVIRYDREPFSWRSQSSQLLRRRLLVMGSVLFHAGILVVFFGHLFGLLTPLALVDLMGIGHSFKQIASMVVGGIAGLIALLGGLMLLWRRIGDPRIRKTSSLGDIFILVLLNLQLLIGLSTIAVSVDHLDGSEMVKFMAWSQGLYTFDLSAHSHLLDVHWIYKLHLFLGLTIFLVFPFTRLVHMLSAPIRFIWRPGYQLVRTNDSGPRAR